MSKQQLQVARDLIHNGWIKGASVKKDAAGGTCYCLSGALVEAGVVGNIWDKVRYATPTNDIVKFNDDPKTTKDDVLKVLDKVIASV